MFGIYEIVNNAPPMLRVAFAKKSLAEQYAKSITSQVHSIYPDAKIKTIIKPIEATCKDPIVVEPEATNNDEA
jgi:hypothetical protein